MPYLIPCADTRCENLVAKLGDLCKECQRHAAVETHDWRADGYTRYDERERAQQGHKGAKKEGKK